MEVDATVGKDQLIAPDEGCRFIRLLNRQIEGGDTGTHQVFSSLVMKTPDTPINDGHSDALVTATEVARHYRVTSRYVLLLARNGSIPSVRVGVRRVVRFKMPDVVAALEGGAQ